MKNKTLVFILLLSITLFSSGIQAMENPEDGRVILRTFARHFDNKVIDAFIISSCSSYGAVVGNQVAITVSHYGFEYFGARFNPKDHWEDELGAMMGGVIGYHTGLYLVDLRHVVTDRLFPQIASFSHACVSATHRGIQNKTMSFANWMCGILSRQENRLNGFATKTE